jgi:DNA polymerase III subunit alpha
VKFDFLGLKTLTVIDIASRSSTERPDGGPLRHRHHPLDDAATYALLQSGETTNVFQLESSGMQELFKQLRPDRFEDIIAAVALYRPGPLGPAWTRASSSASTGASTWSTRTRACEEALDETHGVIVYQEQVMQIAQEMAGYSLGGADLSAAPWARRRPRRWPSRRRRLRRGRRGARHVPQKPNGSSI